MTPAISVTGLTRRYPDQVALDDVHLTIGTETITGLLGRNGAGKTTLLRRQLASRPTRPPDCDRRHRDRASISALKLTGQGILLAPRWSLALERFL
jgi:ATPase subunit of ABC transporter with duplicated ATPase domains